TAIGRRPSLSEAVASAPLAGRLDWGVSGGNVHALEDRAWRRAHICPGAVGRGTRGARGGRGGVEGRQRRGAAGLRSERSYFRSEHGDEPDPGNRRHYCRSTAAERVRHAALRLAVQARHVWVRGNAVELPGWLLHDGGWT